MARSENRERLPDWLDLDFDVGRMNQLTQILERRLSSLEEAIIEIDLSGDSEFGSLEFAPLQHTHNEIEILDLGQGDYYVSQDYIANTMQLGDISDVDLTGALAGYALVRNPANDGWITTALSGGGLFTPTITNPQPDDVLIYNGSIWENVAQADAGFVLRTGDTMSGELNFPLDLQVRFGDLSHRIGYQSSLNAMAITSTRDMYISGGVSTIESVVGGITFRNLTALDTFTFTDNAETLILQPTADDWDFYSATAGNTVRFTGRNSGDTNDNTMLVMNPDGAVDQYFGDTLRTSTTNAGMNVFGTLLDIDSDGILETGIQIRSTLGGWGLKINELIGAFELQQLTSAGAEEKLGFRMARNSGLLVYHNGDNRFETTSFGIEVEGPDADRAEIELTAISSNDAALLVQNINGGYRLNLEAGSGDVEFWQTTFVGADEELWMYAARNAGVTLYYDGTAAFRTIMNGGQIWDGTGWVDLVLTSRDLTIDGTASEIDVAGGTQDLSADRTWTVGLADNAVLPGTSSATIPIGTTAQEPTAANGMVRWDSDLQTLRFAEGATPTWRSAAFAGGAFHDGFSDFVGNEHIDHSAVTLTLTGDTNEIAIGGAAQDLTSNLSFTVGIADDAVLPGTGSVTIPLGTTAQEPAASNGMLRYDTDTNLIRGVINGAWETVQTGNEVSNAGIGEYTYESTTTTPPASGELRFDNATIGSATNLYVHETNADSVDVSAFLALLGDGAVVFLQGRDDREKWVAVELSSATDNGTDWTFGIQNIAVGPTALVDGDPIDFLFTTAEGAGGGGGALGDLSDVTLTSVATGDTLYKSAGDWVNTNVIERTTDGAAINGPAGADAWLELFSGDTSAFDPRFTIYNRNTNFGAMFTIDSGQNDLQIRQMASSRQTTGDIWMEFQNNGSVYQFNNAQRRTRTLGGTTTGEAGFGIYANNENASLVFTDNVVDSINRLGRISHDTGNADFRIEALVDGEPITMWGNTAGSVARQFVDFDADDGLDFYHPPANAVHIRTNTDGAIIPTTGAFTIPVGTTAQEPTPANGMLRYDSTTGKLRGVEGGAWTDLVGAGGGGGALNDLTDVTITAAATGDIMYKSAGDWVNTANLSWDETNDILRVGALAGQHLIIDGGDSQPFIQSQAGASTDFLQLNPSGGTVRVGSASGAGGLEVYNTDGNVGLDISQTGGRWDGRVTAGGWILDILDSAGDDLFLISAQPSSASEIAFYNNGQQINITGQNGGSTAQHNLIRMDADTGITFYYDNSTAFELLGDNSRWRSFNNGNDPTAGGSQSVFQTYLNNTGAQVGTIGYIATANFEITNNVHGGNVQLRSEDSGGVEVLLFDGDPDGSSVLYHDAGAALTTSASGIAIANQTGSVVEIDFDDGGTVDSQIRVNASGATDIMSLRTDGLALLQLQGNSASNSTVIIGTQTGAGSSIWLQHGTGRFTTLSASTFNIDVDVLNIDGQGAAQRLRWLGPTNGGVEMLYADGSQTMTIAHTTDAGVAQETIMEWTRDGDVAIWHDDVEVARTLAAASGGFEVNNTSTGAGFERVLTTSDLGSLTGLDALSDVTITAAATGDMFYKSAGDWVNTSLLSWDETNHLLTVDSASVADSGVLLLSNLGGARMNLDGSTTGQFQLYQTTSGGVDEDLWIRATRNSGVTLFHNNESKLSTTSDGAEIQNSAGGTTTLEVTGIASADTHLLVQNGNGGYKINVEASTGDMEIWQTTFVGVEEDLWIYGNRDGELDLYYNGLLAARTDAQGLVVRDTAGSLAALIFQTDAGVQNGVLFNENGGDGLTVRSNLHGGLVRIDAEDTGGTVRNLIVGDPDGGLSLYDAGVERFIVSASAMTIQSTASDDTTANFIRFDHADGTLRGLLGFNTTNDLLIDNSIHGGRIVLSGEDGGGTFRTTLIADPADDVSLYDVGVEVARTLPAASGGWEINNTLTGAGFERALTESDVFGGSDTFKYKDATTSRNTTVTLADDDDLAGYVLEADTMYSIEGYLEFRSTSATPGMRWGFQTTLAHQSHYYSYIMVAQTGGVGSADNQSTTSVVTETMGASDTQTLHFKGYVHTNSGGSPTVDFQWAQNVSNASNTQLRAGSWIKFTKMGVA